MDPHQPDLWYRKETLYRIDPRNLVDPEVFRGAEGFGVIVMMDDKRQVRSPLTVDLTSMDWSARNYRGLIDEFERTLGPEAWPTYLLGQPDGQRVATGVGI